MKQSQPKIHSQHEYYDKFIVPHEKRNRSGSQSAFQPVGKSISARKQSTYTPLKDLLTKNHDDRVRDYLSRMEGLSIDEVVRTQTFKPNPKKKEEFGTQKQLQIVDKLRSQATELSRGK